MGLISPQRTASGWRFYGERDLIRLNTITLLKSAGLTLAQIRTATNLNEQDPSLQHVLEMQVDAWKAKQADAARGQAIVEAALKSLHAHQALTIDELCNLVRSLEMSEQRSNSPTDANAHHEIVVDTKVLDGYVGFYRFREHGIMTISRDGTRLIGQLTDNPPHELTALSDTEFLSEAVNAHARFIANTHGQADSVIVYQDGFRHSAQRIDAQALAEMQARLATKIQNQLPTAGSEAALRRMLEGIAAGTPNYEAMTPAFAQITRQQLPQLQAISKFLGALQTIEFRGVGKQGWDVYQVQRENGCGQWRILLNSNGVIEGASAQLSDTPGFSFFPTNASETNKTDADNQPQTTTVSEAALRRMIDGIRNGNPNYDEMSPLLAQSIRQQLSMLQTIGKRLGGMLSVEYKGSITRHYDIFNLHRENGTAQWRIAMDDSGVIAEASALLTGSSLAAGP
jgi:DNA-binding transcriptional MerR regulator